MGKSIVAKRYGDAFLAEAKDSIGADKAVEELKNLKMLILQNPEFVEFLRDVAIRYRDKLNFIDRVLEGFSDQTRQFVKLLLQKERLKNLPDICDYVRINYGRGENVDALLKTANLIELDMVRKIKTRLENKLKKKLNLYIELDPDLLGGVQLTVGNILIDGSLKRRLDDLREELKKIKVS